MQRIQSSAESTTKNNNEGNITSTSNNDSSTSTLDQHYYLRIAHIPAQYQIQIIYYDDAIIVINKPGNLRSIPGHAEELPTTTTTTTQQSASLRRRRRREGPTGTARDEEGAPPSAAPAALSAQQAWIEAIRSFGSSSRTSTTSNDTTITENHNKSHEDDAKNKNEPMVVSNHQHTTTTKKRNENQASSSPSCCSSSIKIHDSCCSRMIDTYIQRIGAKEQLLSSIPRKYKLFVRYLQRCRHRIFYDDNDEEYYHHITSSSSNTNNKRKRKKDNKNNHDKDNERNHNKDAADNDTDTTDEIRFHQIIQQMFQRIEQRQIQLQNLPTPTKLEDSAFGQLILMGFNSSNNTNHDRDNNSINDIRNHDDDDDNNNNITSRGFVSRANPKLFTVHRLDMATSGIMIFARSSHVASILSQMWRRKRSLDHTNTGSSSTSNNMLSKIYIARVHNWLPYQQNHQLSGCINVPLIPHPTERLKWKVANSDKEIVGSKSSITLWRIMHSNNNHDTTGDDQTTTFTNPEDFENKQFEINQSKEPRTTLSSSSAIREDSTSTNTNSMNGPITLQLEPITGRTHQLRVHCAHVSNGIIGDRFYGIDPIPINNGRKLYLHAYRLSFVHPITNQSMTFQVEPNDW